MSADELPTAEELQERAAALFAAWRVADTAVEVAWNARLSTTAGRAFVRRGRIELNPRLLANATDQIDAVLAHEAAHVAAFRLFGANIPAHGRHWRSLMRLAGHEPQVTHRIPLDGIKRRRPRRFVYLRLCATCGDRALLSSMRYGRCPGCSQRDGYLVLKARATKAGRRALELLSDTEVRAHFG